MGGSGGVTLVHESGTSGAVNRAGPLAEASIQNVLIIEPTFVVRGVPRLGRPSNSGRARTDELRGRQQEAAPLHGLLSAH